jgi:hypothetical protein
VPADVSGNADYGSLIVAIGTPAYSPVFHTDSVVNRTFTITPNKYAAGLGSVKIYVRGATGAFGKWDVAPDWQEYTAPIAQNWWYLQLKVEYTV